MSQQALYLTEPGDAGPISSTDVNQGGVGDCFLMATIAEEAYWHPDLIANAIHDNGDGTQTVRLYSLSYDQNYHQVLTLAPVTVTDANFASNGVNSGGEAVVNGVKEIWPQVLEAAYAQANGGLAAIGAGGFPLYAMMQLTGQLAVALAPSQVSASVLRQYQAAGDLITFDTSATGNLPYGLINGHSYFYKGIETISGKDYVSVGNPWGHDQPALVAVSDLPYVFVEVDIGTVLSAGTVAITPVPAPVPTPTPAPPTPPTPAAGLVLNVSEDAYQGDAQFTVTIDGVQVGTYTATASHAAGQVQGVAVASTLAAGSHRIGITFINDAYGGPGLDRNLYVAGATYNGTAVTGAATALYSNGTDAFAVTAGSPAPPLTEGGGLVINVAEDAYQGDAQFKVFVDGQQVGGAYTATASHAAGQSQVITVASTLGSGPHQVGISFINDAYGGSPSTDRNLYVTGASYDGHSISGASAVLNANGTATFGVAVGGGLTSTAVLNLSEDAYQGDAQFRVSIDGQAFGGVYTATASHAAGQSQAITIGGIQESFAPHDLAITFLNDAYGGSPSTDRNLYVSSVQFDGQAVAGAASSLFSNGTVHLALVAPASYAG